MDNHYKLFSSDLQNKALSPSDKLLLAAIHSHPIDTQSSSEWAAHTGLPVRTVQDSIANLNKAVMIDIIHNPGLPSTYRTMQRAGQYYALDSKVAADRSLKPTDKILYAVICSYAAMERGAYPSQQTLEKVTGFSVRTIKRSTKRLKDKHLLTVSRNNYGLVRHNTYIITEAANVYSSTRVSKGSNDSIQFHIPLKERTVPCKDYTNGEAYPDGPTAEHLVKTVPYLIEGSSLAPRSFMEAFIMYLELTGQKVRPEYLEDRNNNMDIYDDPTFVLSILLIMPYAQRADTNDLKTCWRNPYKAAENWQTVRYHTLVHIEARHIDPNSREALKAAYGPVLAKQALQDIQTDYMKNKNIWHMSDVPTEGPGSSVHTFMSRFYGEDWLHDEVFNKKADRALI